MHYGWAMQVAGKHVLITGASSGIGAALAAEFASRGAQVSLAARRLSALEQLVGEISGRGGRAAALRVDLSQPGAGMELAERVRAEHGHVDVLVNNAGVSGGVSLFLDKNPTEIREAIEVNFVQPIALARQLMPEMVARGDGALVSVATASVFLPTTLGSIYIATKRALECVDEVLRMELAGSGVHVLTVYPGPVNTPMLQKTMATDVRARRVLQPFMGTTSELAKRSVDALEARKTTLIYPGKFGVARVLSPLVGPVLTRFSAALGLNR